MFKVRKATATGYPGEEDSSTSSQNSQKDEQKVVKMGNWYQRIRSLFESMQSLI